jgi:hypothetical protein
MALIAAVLSAYTPTNTSRAFTRQDRSPPVGQESKRRMSEPLFKTLKGWPLVFQTFQKSSSSISALVGNAARAAASFGKAVLWIRTMLILLPWMASAPSTGP